MFADLVAIIVKGCDSRSYGNNRARNDSGKQQQQQQTVTSGSLEVVVVISLVAVWN